MKFIDRPKQESISSDKFLKMKDGETRSGVFRGEIYSYYVIWKDGRYQEAKSSDPGSTQRHKANFVMYEGNKFIAKVFEFSDPVYDQLAEINKIYPLESTKIQIS